jgi:hypothetical protein
MQETDGSQREKNGGWSSRLFLEGCTGCLC